MSWFFIALIGPILYAFANHTDKYIISKYLKDGGAGALIIFSSIFGILALPVVFYIHPDVFTVTLFQGIILAINSMFVVIAILFYFYALQKDEASIVVPFYQTIPIFAFILGYFILGETISNTQIFSAIIIISGALILSLNLNSVGNRFKIRTMLFMLGASFLYAVNGVVFKLIAVDEGFWPSTFWGLIGKILLGFAFLFFVPSYRNQFKMMIKNNKVAILSLNSLSESLFIIGEGVMQYATLLAPVALVLLVNSFQPLFVLILGIILTLLFPQIGREAISKKFLTQKILGISLIILGAYFIAI